MKRQFLLILFFHPLLLVLLLYSVFVYLNCVCVCVSLRSHRGNIFSSNIHNSVCNCLRIFLVQTQCHLMNDLKSVMVHGTSKQNNNSNNKWSQHTACTFPKALFLQAFLRMVSATILFQIPFLNLFFFLLSSFHFPSSHTKRGENDSKPSLCEFLYGIYERKMECFPPLVDKTMHTKSVQKNA